MLLGHGPYFRVSRTKVKDSAQSPSVSATSAGLQIPDIFSKCSRDRVYNFHQSLKGCYTKVRIYWPRPPLLFSWLCHVSFWSSSPILSHQLLHNIHPAIPPAAGFLCPSRLTLFEVPGMLDTFILKSTNKKGDLRLMTLRCKGYNSMMLGRENHSEKQ